MSPTDTTEKGLEALIVAAMTGKLDVRAVADASEAVDEQTDADD